MYVFPKSYSFREKLVVGWETLPNYIYFEKIFLVTVSGIWPIGLPRAVLWKNNYGLMWDRLLQ